MTLRPDRVSRISSVIVIALVRVPRGSGVAGRPAVRAVRAWRTHFSTDDAEAPHRATRRDVGGP